MPRKIIKYSFILIFLVGIVTPSVLMIFTKNEDKNTSTVRASLDTLTSVKFFPQSFGEAFSKSFEGRKQLIQWFYLFRVFGIRETFLDEKVIVGKDGWLYYGPRNDGYGIEDLLGKIKLSKNELSTIIKNAEEQATWLEKRGIKFLIVFAPNKQTIYPEFLPAPLTLGKETVLDQIITGFKQNGKIPFLDLRDILYKKKKEGSSLLYFKTDTHWNKLGAFYGWEAIRERIEESPVSLKNNVQVSYYPSGGREISKMYRIESEYNDEEPSVDSVAYLNSSKMKAVFFHDSFYNYFRPFTQQYFDTIYERPHFWNSFDYKLVDEVKPDMVVYQMVERYSGALLRDNPKEIKRGFD